MDEQAYREAYQALNDYPCPFEKAILTRCCQCGRARKLGLAEREAVACNHPQAYQQCRDWLRQLQHNARFALHLPPASETAPLPHAQAMKIKCGGMLGLQAALYPDKAEAHRVEDIAQIVSLAYTRFSRCEDFPYQHIIRYVAAYQGRPKRSRRRDR